MRKLGTVVRFKDASDDVRWRVRVANGHITAGSGEGYRHTADMEAGRMVSLKVLYADATPEERAEVLAYAARCDANGGDIDVEAGDE